MRPYCSNSEVILLADCRERRARTESSWSEMPGDSKVAARIVARPADAIIANNAASSGSMSPVGNTRGPSAWRNPCSMRSQVCQRAVAWEIESSRPMSLIRAQGRTQRYRKTCRRRAFARLLPCPSRSSSSPSRATAFCRARPSPRGISRPLVLLENQVEDLLRLQAAEVGVRHPVERLLEGIADFLRHRPRQEELPQLGRSLDGRRSSPVHALDHDPETADDLEGMGRGTVTTVAALDDFQEPCGIRVARVQLQVDDAVREIHRDHGLGTREVRGPMLLESAKDRSDLPGLLEHVADEVPLLVGLLHRPQHRGERIHDDARGAALPISDEGRELFPDEV